MIHRELGVMKSLDIVHRGDRATRFSKKTARGSTTGRRFPAEDL
jgi:hypothetical protein